ncbi:hypothetical protein CGRA01v4_05372 [Colletotrichum graminicola]|uniref:Zn(2)-C6 fungal-type domain-containing protein n=1 Tax=Colletotrichum graminicola (strain M1.001 / M2 / FGSC 10212) TaxID=645133 RepID=E3Q636_COLGM|nr:uncharacterized protein GLRG_01428 [Colletotrichum graminicola M1.001]EFQ26284.1 hypothetical protein GLRG_01428 [Colletotrichum graminicola M1.001]WDK14091.1 hypothetical protein CGRA01v4_05372 [Colletotrichum graminicola]
MPQSSPQSKSVDGVVKHRACDECRSRKLACTKEPDGCSRCKREGLRCVYSPQKQMGRPRKRRHVEESERSPSSDKPQRPDEQPQVPLFTQPTLDTDFSAFFTQDYYSNFDYLDLLSPLEGPPPSTLPPELSSLSMAHAEPRYPAEDFQLGVGGVDLLGGINFSESDSADEGLPQDINKSFTSLSSEQVPGRTGSGVSPPTSSETSRTLSTSDPKSPSSCINDAKGINPESEAAVKAYSNASCPCLSQMFLSLDALSRLPGDVKIARGIARSAARVARNVIRCPACSLTDFTKPPPIQAFQNMMMLSAIFSSTTNAYAKILELIDNETARAIKEARNITFSFNEYGGLWGEMRCSAPRMVEGREMDPATWRVSTRALLRIDIYGYDFERKDGAGSTEPYHYLGLRDIIKQMEDRSNRRHDQLHAMVAAGLPHPMLHTCQTLMVPEGKDGSRENRHCLKIIDMARIALDKLVIS